MLVHPRTPHDLAPGRLRPAPCGDATGKVGPTDDRLLDRPRPEPRNEALVPACDGLRDERVEQRQRISVVLHAAPYLFRDSDFRLRPQTLGTRALGQQEPAQIAAREALDGLSVVRGCVAGVIAFLGEHHEPIVPRGRHEQDGAGSAHEQGMETTSRRNPRPSGTTVALALGGLLAVSSGAGACAPAGVSWPVAGLSDARDRWAAAGYDDYAFTLTSSCGERNLVGDFDVEVAGGEVVAVAASLAHLEMTPESYVESGGRTIDGFLDLVDERHDDVTDVAFDDVLGYPTSLTLDPMPRAIDDEECYAITDVHPARA